MRTTQRWVVVAVASLEITLGICWPGTGHAATAGDIVQSDTLGTSVWSHNFDSGKDTTLANAFGLAEFVGLHYFLRDDVRVGMNIQFSELVVPSPAPGASRFTTFALLPQVGWTFHPPFFIQATFALPLRAYGRNELDLGVQAIGGVSLPLTDRLNLSLALEVPYFFRIYRTLGATPLVGVSWRL